MHFLTAFITLSFLKMHFFIMHFLKTPIFYYALLQKFEPNSPLILNHPMIFFFFKSVSTYDVRS